MTEHEKLTTHLAELRGRQGQMTYIVKETRKRLGDAIQAYMAHGATRESVTRDYLASAQLEREARARGEQVGPLPERVGNSYFDRVRASSRGSVDYGGSGRRAGTYSSSVRGARIPPVR